MTGSECLAWGVPAAASQHPAIASRSPLPGRKITLVRYTHDIRMLKGTKGSYEKLGLDPQEPRLIEGVLPTEPSWADEAAENYGCFYGADDSEIVATERGGYQHYFLQMAEAIRNHTAPPVKAEDALWNIKLIELAMESSRLGQKLSVTKA